MKFKYLLSSGICTLFVLPCFTLQSAGLQEDVVYQSVLEEPTGIIVDTAEVVHGSIPITAYLGYRNKVNLNKELFIDMYRCGIDYCFIEGSPTISGDNPFFTNEYCMNIAQESKLKFIVGHSYNKITLSDDDTIIKKTYTLDNLLGYHFIDEPLDSNIDICKNRIINAKRTYKELGGKKDILWYTNFVPSFCLDSEKGQSYFEYLDTCISKLASGMTKV